MIARLLRLAAALLLSAGAAVAQTAAVPAETPAAAPLVERLRAGGLVLFFRHADTSGMACDRSFRIGDREGQRNISPAGREQSRAIGPALARLSIPIERPVLAGPVYRARDTAELAFGRDAVAVDEALTADDYAGPRLAEVLDGHRRLLSAPVAAGANRVLVGHRTPAIMIFGQPVGGRAFPEGTALVVEPGGGGPRLLGILAFAPVVGSGFHQC